MIFRLLLFSFCLGSTHLLQAQGDTNKSIQGTSTTGRDTPEESPKNMTRIDLDPTVERYVNMMDSIDKEELTAKGYRIQLFSSSGPNARQDALEYQSDFLKLYEKTNSYTLWNYPNWVVRIGDYRTHLSALEFHMEIRELYPASFITTDEIKVDYSKSN